MNRVLGLTAIACCAWFSAVRPASAQDAPQGARNSIALRGGYAFASGDWDKVPYLPEVRMLAGRFVYGMDIEVRIGERWTLALDGGFEKLDGGDWESYAAAQGDTLSVDASFFYAAVLARPHLTEGGANVLRLEFGPAAIFPSGKERLNGRLYTYDFFNSTKLGGMIGIEYVRALDTWVAVALRASALVAPSGITYADGDTRMLIALPVTAGIRFTF